MSYRHAIVASEQLTLGQLIQLLEGRPADHSVQFDFGYFAPSRVSSYRGYYEDLAIEYDREIDPKVSDVLSMLRGAIGRTFTGWKGGDYVMGEDTPLWVANAGDAGSTAVVGLAECNWQTVIATAFYER